MNASGRILLVDDDKAVRNALRRALEKQGYVVEAHGGGAPALASLKAGGDFDLVITDLKMPEMDGLELLRRVKTINAQMPVMMITAFGTIENAVEAMRLGARDYLTKPLDLFEVRTKVDKALQATRLTRENRNLADENRELRRQLGGGPGVESIIGVSPGMAVLKKKVKQVAPTVSSVLIIGESGTGKELVARALHDESKRKERPFLPINCAAIPKDILESELFGHERGAFTGATSRKPGKFEMASGGTIFLDEIGELAQGMQAKLLRFLEERSFMRVGGVETVEVDVRILAATNADLETLVARGEFRTDLYYRLKVVTLDIPPLRSRPDDIPVLLGFFLEKLAQDYSRPGLTLTTGAVGALSRQPWAGNVRELRNLVESLVVLNDGDVLDLEHLPPEYGGIPDPGEVAAGSAAQSSAVGAGETAAVAVSIPQTVESGGEGGHTGAGATAAITVGGVSASGAEASPYEPGISMAELEKRHILRTLEEQDFNRTRAAKILGIGRRTLQRKLEEYKEQGEDIPPGVPE